MQHIVCCYFLTGMLGFISGQDFYYKGLVFCFFSGPLYIRKVGEIMKKLKVFLGGTCASSTWRQELLNELDGEKVDAFNPVVPDWTPECQQEEDYHRANDDICLYVITPEGEGFYSFVEVTDDSNKRPEKTVLCLLESANGKNFEGHMKKCALKTAKLVSQNGVVVFDNLQDLSEYLNNCAIKVCTK